MLSGSGTPWQRKRMMHSLALQVGARVHGALQREDDEQGELDDTPSGCGVRSPLTPWTPPWR